MEEREKVAVGSKQVKGGVETEKENLTLSGQT